jgi:uncharacterized LabA/DUF88 family protein
MKMGEYEKSDEEVVNYLGFNEIFMNSVTKLYQSTSKVGVFVDSANMYRNGGIRMQYDVLREFACRDNSEPVRMNAYVSYDARRAKTDYDYRKKAEGFHSALRDIGFKVIIKEVKWYVDEFGEQIQKANADLDLAVDALLQSENLDRVLIASGDGDFVQVVRALQNKGCRVEVVALDNVSSALRQEADLFMSGYLIPNLIPTPSQTPEWGQVGSWVRGWCYYYDDTKGIGFMRYLSRIDKGLWLTDKRRYAESPFETAFFHFSKLQDDSLTNKLPSRDFIFEFRLAPSERGPDKLSATEIRLASEL